MGGGETRDGEFSGAREASPEERAFHAQQINSPQATAIAPRNTSLARRSRQRVNSAGDAPNPRARRPREERPEPREERSEGTQAPLDLPPPPPAKPFVVWSSSPTGTPTDRAATSSPNG